MAELVTEIVDGESYLYYPLGEYVMRALGVCRGRPTFKYTRIEITGTLERLAAGETVDNIVTGYRGRVSPAAIREAVELRILSLVTSGEINNREEKQNMQQHPLTLQEQRALEHFKLALQSLLAENLSSLRLFGSRARGEGTAESDLDVLIVLQNKDRALCRRIVAEALEIDLVYEVNLAPTILSEAEYQQNKIVHTPFYRNIERESLSL